MKYKVIGWADYDSDYEEAILSSATDVAIAEEVKKNGYYFHGVHHLCHKNCTPILNTGKKCCYSDVYWGRIMAIVNNDLFEHAERLYVNGNPCSNYVFPKGYVNEKEIVDEKSLNEIYELDISEKQFENVTDPIIHTLYMDYDEKYTKVDTGDIFRMKFEDFVVEKRVAYAEIKYHYMTKIKTVLAIHIHFDYI